MELTNPPDDALGEARSLVLELASKSQPYEKLTFTYGETMPSGDETLVKVDGKFFLDRSPEPLATIFELTPGLESPTVVSQEVTLASES